jgi:hypothetical protein
MIVNTSEAKILTFTRVLQKKFIAELESGGICTLERWTHYAKQIANSYMLEGLLTANVKGIGRLSGRDMQNV